MATPLHVLCFGKNEMLLRTRSAILAKDATVIAVASLSEVSQLPPNTCCDIMLLCHTLTEAECMGVSEIVRSRWPEAKIVALTSNNNAPCHKIRPDRELLGLAGPEALLQAIRHVRASEAIPAR